MVNKNKIITMTRLALYDKHEGFADRVVNDYFRHDHIYRNNLGTRMAVGLGGLIILAIYWIQALVANNLDIFEFDIQQYVTDSVLFLLAILAVYSLIGSIQGTRQYYLVQKRLAQYQAMVRQLERQEERAKRAEEDEIDQYESNTPERRQSARIDNTRHNIQESDIAQTRRHNPNPHTNSHNPSPPVRTAPSDYARPPRPGRVTPPEVERTRRTTPPELAQTRRTTLPELDQTRRTTLPELESTRRTTPPEAEPTRRTTLPESESTRRTTLPASEPTRSTPLPEPTKRPPPPSYARPPRPRPKSIDEHTSIMPDTSAPDIHPSPIEHTRAALDRTSRISHETTDS